MATSQGKREPPSAAPASSPHATRVESLFHLVRDCPIEEGSSLAVRENAAEKLGEVACRSPVYCRSILQQIRELLVDKAWDVRVAAAKCVDVIARSCRATTTHGERVALRFARASFAGRETSCPRLNFRTVDMTTVLRDGAPLLRSGGEEYEYQTNRSEDERRVQAVRQRQLLLRRICGASGGAMWKSGEDALAQQMLPRLNSEHVKELADDIEASELAVDDNNEVLVDDTRKRAAEILPEQPRAVKKVKAESIEFAATNGDGVGDSDERTVDMVALLVADLFESVFDSKWEVRHGGFAALRHILFASGLIDEVNRQKKSESNVGHGRVVDQWIEESLVRCMCVLALDQFVDYSADGSVAPVRELAAQVYGILLGSLHDPELVKEYIAVLRKLLGATSWHTAHGGLLGIRYLLQAHISHAHVLVPLVVDDVVSILEVKRAGAEDDILIVASAILHNVVQFLPLVSRSIIHKAARSLWSIVTMPKTTGSSVSTSIIQTLRVWYEYVPVARILREDMDAKLMWENIRHIVPLLHHNEKLVRDSTSTCIEAVIGQGDHLLRDNCSQGTLRCLQSHLLLQLLRDEEEDSRRALLSAWTIVVEWCAAADKLVELVRDRVPCWIELLSTLEKVQTLDVISETEENCSDQPSISLPSKENLGARVAYAEALGVLASRLPQKSDPFETAIEGVTRAMNSRSGEEQCGVLLFLYWWVICAKKQDKMLSILRDRMTDTLGAFALRDWVPQTAPPAQYYSEQVGSLQRLLRMQGRLVEIFASAQIHVEQVDPLSTASPSAAMVSRHVAERVGQYPFSNLSKHPKEFELAHFCRQDLFLVDEVIQQAFSRMYARVQGIGSCVYCELLVIPSKKSGFLVKALMEAIKTEENPTFRDITAKTLAQFVISQADVQRKCVTKIVSNLCNSAVALAYREEAIEPTEAGDKALDSLQVRVVGAEQALQAICQSSSSLDCLPVLPEVVKRGWCQDSAVQSDRVIQENAHLVVILSPSLREGSKATAVKWVNELSDIVRHSCRFERTRQAVADAIATVCRSLSVSDTGEDEEAMAILYRKMFSGQSSAQFALSDESRRNLAGSIIVLDRLVALMGPKLTPFVPSLLHFSMRAMNAADRTVRSMAAKAFADLLPLIPLQMDLSCSEVHHPGLKKVVQQNESSRDFLESLLQGKAIKEVSVSGVLAQSFTLRDYQQHGINWLKFLVDNQMGGVLADDMGLGKTLQLLAAIAATVSKKKGLCFSLIVCPPIIVHHWIAEAKRCFPGIFGDVVDYSAPASKRKATLSAVRAKCGPVLVVATYAAVRSDREFLQDYELEFLALDEAHLIRNPKSSLFEAVCSLKASHRFVLTGTPLQNHVGDLWALFTFLMPGYLGEYSEFRRQFELPISRAKERTATPKQKELAAQAVSTLHQRVLPFILRRTKDDVLKELPPKIISNVLLSLTPLQQRLYKACSKNEDRVKTSSNGALKGVLHHLQVLKKICIHPLLVKDNDVITEATVAERKSLSNWRHSGKLVGLRDLLVESCDLGGEANSAEECLGGHRCLIFAHLTETLDVIADMLNQALSNVTYLRLDGKTPVAKRRDIVEEFNNDPSIDLLLLTTAVGGLGLTLIGADTVIFVEHSWNPFVDLQAMDRAHRIGQRRTVRVFRLIMEESLEEHIMDLQMFKERVASTVVTSTEASTSMNANTKNVLHLLKTSSSAVKAQEAAAHAEAEALRAKRRNEGGIGIPGVAVELLDEIGDLWDQSQYESLTFPTTT